MKKFVEKLKGNVVFFAAAIAATGLVLATSSNELESCAAYFAGVMTTLAAFAIKEEDQ